MENGINTKGLYIYGIVPTYYLADQFRKLEGTGVFNITFQKVSALVSQNSVIDYRLLSVEPLARLLIDHQKTIENIMNMGFITMIPMRLGTFANNTTEVLKILETGYDLIVDTFEKISNLIEINIVATWSDFSRVLAETALHKQVVEMKAKIEKSSAGVNHSDQLSIGYLVKKILDENRAEYSSKILDSLKPYCQSTKQHEVLNDQMVCNTAFLLNQSQLGMLENALDKLDEALNGKLNFKLVGPLPCYSFFTLEVKSILYNEIESARKELGLTNSTSEKKVKQAYLDKVKLYHPDTNPGEGNPVILNHINNAYQTLLDYISVVKPESREAYFSLQPEAVEGHSVFLKIKK